MTSDNKLKVIIDCDPGIDDAFAVLTALSASPEIVVLAMTASFGNVRTEIATKNIELLLKLSKKAGVIVGRGSDSAMNGKQKEHVADFVHGKDGFGDCHAFDSSDLAPERANDGSIGAEEGGEVTSSEEVMSRIARENPGEVTVICLATATNVVNAMRADKELAKNLKSIVHLGGAYQCSGNVNPVAEANVYADAEAADELYGTHDVDIFVVGLDVTQNVRMSEEKLIEMVNTKSRNDGTNLSDLERKFLFKASQFYMNYHIKSMNYRGILQHDSVCVMSAIKPELFDWTKARVRVATESFSRGKTLMDVEGCKNWMFENAWTGRPLIKIALSANFEGIQQCLFDRYI